MHSAGEEATVGANHGATFFYGLVLHDFSPKNLLQDEVQPSDEDIEYFREECKKNGKDYSALEENWYWDILDTDGLDSWQDPRDPVCLGNTWNQGGNDYFLCIRETLHETKGGEDDFARVSFKLPSTATVEWDRLIKHELQSFERGWDLQSERWTPKFHLVRNHYGEGMEFTFVFYYGIENLGPSGETSLEQREGSVQYGGLEQPGGYGFEGQFYYSYLYIDEILRRSSDPASETFDIPGVDTEEWDRLLEQKCEQCGVSAVSKEFRFKILPWIYGY